VKVKPFGERIVVEFVNELYEGKIIIPERAGQVNRLGRVLFVGDGVVFNGPNRSVVPMHVAVGDVCMFQMEASQELNTRYVVDDKPVFFLHQHDMILKVTGKKLKLELGTVEVIGTWVLVKAFSGIETTLIVPETAKGDTDVQRYRVVQVGSGVKQAIIPGDEVSLVRSRCNPIYFGQELYGFVDSSFVYGSISAAQLPSLSQ